MRRDNTFPVSEYIREEVEARGWSEDDFCKLAGWPIDKSLTCFTVSMAEDVARVFKGTHVMTWLNLYAAYKKRLEQKP